VREDGSCDLRHKDRLFAGDLDLDRTGVSEEFAGERVLAATGNPQGEPVGTVEPHLRIQGCLEVAANGAGFRTRDDDDFVTRRVDTPTA